MPKKKGNAVLLLSVLFVIKKQRTMNKRMSPKQREKEVPSHVKYQGQNWGRRATKTCSPCASALPGKGLSTVGSKIFLKICVLSIKLFSKYIFLKKKFASETG